MSIKKSLRQQWLQQRKAFDQETVNQWSLNLGAHLRSHPWFQAATVIYAYRSFRNELSLDSLWAQDVSQKQWAFPRCEGKRMDWYLWSGQSSFSVSQYGIEEPEVTWPVAPAPDLILVPTVACDRRGYRLGYGGGFYDRMLETLDSAQTIGIVPSVFVQDQLPIDPWDQPLDAVCTELGLIELNQD